MSQEIVQLQAALVQRMQELGAPVTDPRLAPMVAQLQALFKEHYADAIREAQAGGRALARMQACAGKVEGPCPKPIEDLPGRLKSLAESHIRCVRGENVEMFR